MAATARCRPLNPLTLSVMTRILDQQTQVLVALAAAGRLAKWLNQVRSGHTLRTFNSTADVVVFSPFGT